MVEGFKMQVKDVHCGCEAIIYIALDINTMMWHIVPFDEGHNHLLVSHRRDVTLG